MLYGYFLFYVIAKNVPAGTVKLKILDRNELNKIEYTAVE
jgi:hypothetical protein